MKNHRIAKVELAVCDVGLRDSDGVLFVGAVVETGLHEMAMAAFESQYIDKDTYSSSAKDMEVQSCFLDD
ncbi:hypothetical protein Tco_0892517 [Tanacetum coccineum]|uniref:Uncharacterized protein n=1 Tax=Tanacetum coccineum TaxID=301880 RepID=A0ABQ5C6F4_9ASTR